LELEEFTRAQQDTVSELSLSWDLPAVTKINKKWLHKKLLVHAMLLDKVTCPVMDTDDDEDYDAKSMCCVTGFPRTFIDTASSDTQAQLLRFWAGWEVLPSELQVEISGGIFPTSATCFEILTLPACIKTMVTLRKHLLLPHKVHTLDLLKFSVADTFDMSRRAC
ncbi:hypothetical protein GOODEAATRI_016929, partial [Goodea atripinnis]